MKINFLPFLTGIKIANFVIVLLLICTSNVHAGRTVLSALLEGDDIESGRVITLQDDYYGILNPQFDNVSATSRLRLYYTGQSNIYHDADWSVEVQFQIAKYSETGTLLGTVSDELTIDYATNLTSFPNAPDYIIEQVFTYDYAYKSIITITGLTLSPGLSGVVPDDVYFELETEIERYFSFSTTDNPSISASDYTLGDKQVLLVWDYMEGAEEYDLEWYFSTNELTGTAPTNPSDIEDKNFTRVTLSQNWYSLNLVYDDGTLFYRVRGVGRHGSDYSHRLEGEWSDENTDYITVQNENEDKNWTVNTVFAEDGKVKEIVAYFDGSGRQRQIVTRTNSNETAIISETFYDYEGRNAIQTLPAPNLSKSSELKFYEEFSLNSAVALTKEKFDDDASACLSANPTLDDDEGASNYYSADNDDKEMYNAYIPDAGLYPYSRTVYGRDGRVVAQAGPGVDHNIASGHDVKYFYATPMQEKLDRLFGNEVGYAAHYQLQGVIDANGQMSLSYLDLSGKVIATSLVGEEPAAMTALTSNTGANTLTVSFSNLNEWSPVDYGYVINTTVLVESAGEYNFEYNMTTEDFDALCGAEGDDCEYDLFIGLYKVCDNSEIYEDGASSGSPDILHQTQLITSSTTMPITFTKTFSSGQEGTYLLVKKLTLNQAAFNTAVANFEAELPGNCFSLEELEEDFNDAIDFSLCDDCTDGCTEMIEDSCDALLEFLQADMRKGGQYFDNSYVGSLTSPNDDWFVTYVEQYCVTNATSLNGNGSPSTSDFWDHLGFVDGNGNQIDNWQDLYDNFSDDDYVNAAFDDGAITIGSTSYTSLLQFHPEFCHYQACYDMIESRSYDFEMLAIDNFADAQTAGFLPAGSTLVCSLFNYAVSSSAYVMKDDPFYLSSTLTTSTEDANMRARLKDGTCLWSVAGSFLPAACSTYTTACADEQWRLFRALYLHYKYIDVETYLASVSCDYLCDNTTPPDLIADNCGSNDAEVIGFYIRVPDASSYQVSDMDTEADLEDFGENLDDDVFEFGDPCDGHYGFISLSAELIPCTSTTFELLIDGVSVTGAFNTTSYSANPSGLAIAIVARINSTSSSPDYTAIYIGGSVFEIRTASATDDHNGKEVEYKCSSVTSVVGLGIFLNGGVDVDADPCVIITDCFCSTLISDYNLLDDEGSLDIPDDLATNYNAHFGTSVTDTDMQDWYEECTGLGAPSGSPAVPTQFYKYCSPPAYDCDNDSISLNLASYYANLEYQALIDEKIEEFKQQYLEHCFQTVSNDGTFEESFTMEMQDYEYHFTLYYYDQAGNLTRTVPPKGVVLLSGTDLSSVNEHRVNPNDYTKPYVHTDHSMVTMYSYNTLNEIICQRMPDAESTGDLNILNPSTYNNGLGDADLTMLDLHMFNDYDGISIVSDAGTSTYSLYETFDGGLTWDPCTVQPFFGTLPRDIEFINETTGYIVGDDRMAFRIANYSHGGSNTWSTVSITVVGSTVDLFMMEFVDENNGYISCSAGNLIHISGTTTTLAASGIGGTSALRAIAKYGNDISTAILYLGGSSGYLAKVTGLSGTPTVSSIITVTGSNGNPNIRSIAVKNGGNQLIVGGQTAGSYAEAFVIKDITGSISNQRTFSVSGLLVNDIELNNYGIAYLVCTNSSGTTGVIHTSSDFGDTWTDITPASTTGLLFINSGVNGNLLITGTNYVLIAQPDNCSQRFWYDDLGRIKASQDARQANYGTPAYSYTVYDAIGRISEAGQLLSSSEPDRTDLNASNWPVSLISTAATYQVSYTLYDISLGSTIEDEFTNEEQENLRTRVASTWYKVVSTDSDYQFASHYSYDIHGNVKELVQENTLLEDFEQNFKKIAYEYDLISGNVNQVSYQSGQYDEFYHRYIYDADNRLTNAFTSHDSIIWDMDAKYLYYLHGPLARTEIGQQKIQGLDYAYTINGWLKGINGNILDQKTEMGRDGYDGTDGGVVAYLTTREDLHTNFGRDAFGFSLEYFNDDYTGISSHSSGYLNDLNDLGNGAGANNGSELFNGNIRNMSTALMDLDQEKIDLLTGVYQYDQLNRLSSMSAWLSSSDYEAASNSSDYYDELYTYDANGNITTLERNGKSPLGMDDLSYNYIAGTNKLSYVDDAVSSGNYATDIDDQAANNYEYDEMGNLTADALEKIDEIEWNVRGKVSKVKRTTATTTHSDLEFLYDAMGQRIVKIEKPRVSGGVKPQKDWIYTYYVRDAGGNTMATYDLTYGVPLGGDPDEFNASFTVKDLHMYGSSRLGHYRSNIEKTIEFEAGESISGSGETLFSGITNLVVPDYVAERLTTDKVQHQSGTKYYELSNHLGNVLSVVTDKRIPIDDNEDGTGTDVIYYTADVVSFSDYYPFGMLMPDRNGAVSGTDYRYGFQAQECDQEMSNSASHYAFEYRIHDARIGRFLSVDPLSHDYPFYSTYQFAGNSPIMSVDIEGLEPSKNANESEVPPSQESQTNSAAGLVSGNSLGESVVNQILGVQFNAYASPIIPPKTSPELDNDAIAKIQIKPPTIAIPSIIINPRSSQPEKPKIENKNSDDVSKKNRKSKFGVHINGVADYLDENKGKHNFVILYLNLGGEKNNFGFKYGGNIRDTPKNAHYRRAKRADNYNIKHDLVYGDAGYKDPFTSANKKRGVFIFYFEDKGTNDLSKRKKEVYKEIMDKRSHEKKASDGK